MDIVAEAEHPIIHADIVMEPDQKMEGNVHTVKEDDIRYVHFVVERGMYKL